MADAAFDTGAASKALVALGQSIVSDPAYSETGWDALTVVANFQSAAQMFGYAYKNDGTWDAQAPDDFDVLDRFEDLRKAMAKPGEQGWNYCLIQIKRDGMNMHADFDYGDGEKWKVTPANLQTRVEELRPR
jgi:hypothetical protein